MRNAAQVVQNGEDLNERAVVSKEGSWRGTFRWEELRPDGERSGRSLETEEVNLVEAAVYDP